MSQTPAAEMPRILVAGAGLIGRRHVDLVARQGGLSGIADPAAGAAEVARAAGVPHFADLDEALAKLSPEGVILATPNQLHLDHALACIAAGVPVLIEKPVADTVAAAEAIVAAAEAAGVPVLVGHHRRHNPLIAAAHAAIRGGQIGRVVTVAAQFVLIKPDDYFDQVWRRAPGAGPVFINLIHDIDLLRHLCGEIVSVQALESRAARGFEVEDSAAVILRFEGGAVGTVTISDAAVSPWSWEFTSGENPAYPKVSADAYMIAGTEGALSVPSLRLWRHDGAKSWWSAMDSRVLKHRTEDPLVRQLVHFHEVIRGRAAPLVSAREGMATLAVVEAIKTAARTGRAVAP